MYRSIAAVLAIAAFTAALHSSLYAQDDPFGAGADPFGDPPAAVPAPAAAPAARPQRPGNHRFAAILAKAKAALAKGQKPNEIRGFNPSKMERKIRATLNDESAINAIDLPLNDACQVLSETHNIPILVNARALEEIGITPDAPVTINLKGVTLRSLMRLMLRDFDLTYQIDNDVLLVTTIEAAEQNLVCSMFKMSEKMATKKDQIVNAIQRTIVPDTWESLGGPSSIVLVGDVLVVSTTDSVAEEVEKLLNKLSDKLDGK